MGIRRRLHIQKVKFMSSAQHKTFLWNYQSPWWLPSGHLQTIWASRVAGGSWQKKQVSYVRERWSTPDHDFIDVDIQYAQHALGTIPEDAAPWLVLFHGLEGSSQSPYARAFAEVAQQTGWHFAVPHFRGCSGEINRAPRAYHSGDYPEVDWILQRLRQRSKSALRAVGISLGGNALLRWAQMSGLGASQTAKSVCAVCAPLDLMACGLALGQGINRYIYTRVFLATMKPKAWAKIQQYPGLFDYDAVVNAQTLYEFDDAFTAPLHGFKGVEDYWRTSSSRPALNEIQIPALLINARNDPFVPASTLPQRHEVPEHIELWQPNTGGHVGFTHGSAPGNGLAMPTAVVRWLGQLE